MIGALKSLAPELSRFLVIAVLGLIIDVGLASALIVWAGFGDVPAAALGLLAGMIFNYFMHLRWTFRGHGRQASAVHFMQFSLGVGATLVVRIAVLTAIAALGWQDLLGAPVRLGLAAGVSFVFSYLISRVVFLGRAPVKNAQTLKGKS